jgi:zinc/manganese transport system substrate-binding protein
MRGTVVRARTAAVLAALTALLLGGCTAGGPSGPAIASGDPARCPGRVLDVVVSVAQWGQLVHRLAGPCATVTTVISSAAIDPHEYEPTTGDIAAFQEADLVVLDGAGYDSWAAAAVADLDPGPARVVAAQVAGGTDPDPHLWYSPVVVHRMTAAVTARLRALAPADAAVFTRSAAALDRDLAAYDRAVAALRPLAARHTYAATEPVFDRMAHALGLTDATPAGFRRAVSNESDPAPADVAALEAALTGRKVDVLIYNLQTEGAIPDQLRATAQRAGVPVVEVTESPPQGSGSFVAWQTAQLTDLANALEQAR